MKKIIIVLISLVISGFGIAQNGPVQQVAQYTLPLDLSGNQSVDLIPAMSELSPNASYIDLTAMSTKLQSQLGNQTDNLNTNKNLQQKYTQLGAVFENTVYYTDAQKLASLTVNYNNAMKLVKTDIETSKRNIQTINTDIEKITRTINNRMNLEQSQQSFRQWTSMIYAILIAIIILSFFLILFKSNSKETATLLMGESGLQFITLFSLIISIILFGVLNILEGKELAAIISAIAGFILGKYNPGKNTDQIPPQLPPVPPIPPTPPIPPGQSVAPV